MSLRAGGAWRRLSILAGASDKAIEECKRLAGTPQLQPIATKAGTEASDPKA